MKTACLIFLFASSSVCAQQYYLRGEVKDEAGNILPNVTITHCRTGYIYKTGNYGSFGIINSQQKDSLIFSMTGYQKEKVLADADKYLSVKLKAATTTTSSTSVSRYKLTSFTKNLDIIEERKWFASDETYTNIVENQFVEAKKYPTTGMSLNIDRASYSNIRRFINYSSIVPYDAVRIEEMLNYFNLSYDKPDDDNIFKIRTQVTSCPWEKDHQLFFVNLSSQKINLEQLPPGNFVFLIDISGSMDMPNRLPLLQSAFKMLVNNLRDKDTVSIVAYGSEMGVKLDATSGAEKEKIIKAIDELTPGGSTPGESGLRMAYNIAHLHYNKGGNNRIILATDGDFNVGAKKEEDLANLVSLHRQSGIYLTCLGVGMGNYKDSKIQVLAEKGNGNFAYLDNFQEAEKVLFKEFTQTLYSVADNVYMNVDFNPEYVKEYRLIGFDNKAGALRDTASVLEGGEIGSGYSMVAAFEITPSEINKGAIKDGFMGKRFANINLQYRYPKDTMNRHFTFSSAFNFIPIEKADQSYRFASSVIMFGSILRSSPFTKKIKWDNILTLASSSADMESATEREFVGIVQKAKVLYTTNKKKKSFFNFFRRNNSQ